MTGHRKLRESFSASQKRLLENIIHGIFLVMGLVTVGCVLLITVYLVISGIPAIHEIGLVKFLFGRVWASTQAEPQFGILPFILTSIYGTAGAIVLGVPIGFLTAVFLAKAASPRLRAVVEEAVSLLAGIPSVVYGLVGMLVLVPGIRKVFGLPDGASLLAAIIVLAIMILPSIIKVSMTALEAVPPEYEDAPRERSGSEKRHRSRGRSGRRTRHRRGYGGHDGLRQRRQHAISVPERALPDDGGRQRNVLFQRLTAAGAVFHRAGALPVHHAHQRRAELFPQAQ